MAGIIRFRDRWNRADFRGWKYEKLIGLSLREKVFDVYPHLKKYPELNPNKIKAKVKRMSFDKILRYVMIYYSDNVLRHTIPEIPRRKKEAALLAGFELSESMGKFGPDVEEMLLCRNHVINKMIVRFLRRSENKKFLQLCVFEEARAKQMQKLIDGIGEKEKELTKVVIDNVKTLSDDIEQLERDLLNEDDDIDLLEMMYDEVDYNNLGISPEEIAEAEADGTTEKILPSPYRHIHDSTKQRRANKNKGA